MLKSKSIANISLNLSNFCYPHVLIIYISFAVRFEIVDKICREIALQTYIIIWWSHKIPAPKKPCTSLQKDVLFY